MLKVALASEKQPRKSVVMPPHILEALIEALADALVAAWRRDNPATDAKAMGK